MSAKSVDRWSMIGLAVGAAFALVFAAVDIAIWWADQVPALAGPFNGLVILVLAITVIGCIALKIGAWLAQRQDQIKTQIEQLAATVEHVYATGYTDGLARRPPAPALHLVPDLKPDAS